jgi:hypothetical protein
MIADYEAGGWAAYYERNWPQVLALMVRLNRAQFGMSWLHALAAAFDTVRAAAAFAPAANDLQATRHHLTRFFARARRNLGISADAATLAELELDYWVVHRALASRRQRDASEANLTPMIDSLTRLHAALFDITNEQAQVSAALRALAAARVDRITSGTSTDSAGDWMAIRELLCSAYRSVQAVERRAAVAQEQQ